MNTTATEIRRSPAARSNAAQAAARAARARVPASPASAAHGAEDAALVARCLAGDRAAWGELVQRYQRLVYTVACRAGLDEHGAADVFQTVFSRLVQHLPRIAEPERLQAWIVTTAKRATLAALREAKRHVSMSADDDEDGAGEWDVADTSPIAEQALDELQQLNRLRAAIERLDERNRALVLLLFRDEDERLPYEEIGRRLGLPLGSIGPMRARCLEKLRRLMAD